MKYMSGIAAAIIAAFPTALLGVWVYYTSHEDGMLTAAVVFTVEVGAFTLGYMGYRDR